MSPPTYQGKSLHVFRLPSMFNCIAPVLVHTRTLYMHTNSAAYEATYALRTRLHTYCIRGCIHIAYEAIYIPTTLVQRRTCGHLFQLTSSEPLSFSPPSSSQLLTRPPWPWSTSLPIQHTFLSPFLLSLKKRPPSLMGVGTNRFRRFILISHKSFELGLKMGPLAVLCGVTTVTTIWDILEG